MPVKETYQAWKKRMDEEKERQLAEPLNVPQFGVQPAPLVEPQFKDKINEVVQSLDQQTPAPEANPYDTNPILEALAPKRDPEKESRLKKVAAVNSIGDALRVAVQAMGAAKGANVTPLNTTQTTDKALNRLQFLDDKFENEEQRYNMLKYQDQLTKIGFKRQDDQIANQDEKWNKSFDNQVQQQGIQNQRAGRQEVRQESQYKDSVDWRNKTNQQQQDHQNKVLQENQRQFNERLAAMKSRDEQNAVIKMIQAKAKADVASGKGVELVLLDPNLNPMYTIDESELNAIMGKISNHPDVKKEVDSFKLQFGESLTKENKKYFVQKYWHYVSGDFGGLTPYDNTNPNNPAGLRLPDDEFGLL